MAELTAKQVGCLRDCQRLGSILSFDYGSTTINVLRHRGFLEYAASVVGLVLTESGRNELARLSMLEARHG